MVKICNQYVGTYRAAFLLLTYMSLLTIMSRFPRINIYRNFKHPLHINGQMRRKPFDVDLMSDCSPPLNRLIRSGYFLLKGEHIVTALPSFRPSVKLLSGAYL